MIFNIFIALITIALLIFACIAILNTLTFPRLRALSSPHRQPAPASASESTSIRLSVSESVDLSASVRLSASESADWSAPIRLSVSESVDLSASESVDSSASIRLSASESADWSASQSVPLVSICIPARNEAAIIAETIRAWLSQTYPNFELILLDDHSTDDTAKIARLAAQNDPRVRIIMGEPLPPGWKGKNWACHQLSQHASGDLLIFTDADVRWQSGALFALVSHFTQTQAHLLTVWPTQQTLTWGERLVVPLMALAIMAYLPVLAVHHIPWPIFAAANGQCLIFRRDAYHKIGGHAAVRANIVEDMGFAYAIKRAGMRLRMADGNGLITTRMYRNWPETRDGFAKNILGGHGNSIFFLLLSTLFHWSVFTFPALWFLYALSTFHFSFTAFILTASGCLIRALTAAATRQRIADAIFMPLSPILMTLIVVRALHWRFSGGPQWKGRTYAES